MPSWPEKVVEDASGVLGISRTRGNVAMQEALKSSKALSNCWNDQKANDIVPPSNTKKKKIMRFQAFIPPQLKLKQHCLCRPFHQKSPF